MRRASAWLRRAWQTVRPGRRAWTGAALGVLVLALAFCLPATWAFFSGTEPPGLFIGFLGFVIIGAAAGVAAWLLQRLLRVPSGLYLASAAGAVAVLRMSLFGVPNSLPVILAAVAIFSLLGAAGWVLAQGGWRRSAPARRAVVAGGLVVAVAGGAAGAAWLLPDGRPVDRPVNAGAQAAGLAGPLDLPDPAQPGPYAVQTLTYGSGHDRHRPEYAAQADLITQPVDGSLLVSGWSGLRRDYWGFGPEALPLNGRAWVPEGPGPFPLVLIVHGNHIAEYYSDPGYAYLGEMLASRGFILVSVDENFLNLSPSADLVTLAGLTVEDDARGWLLLEHLRTWREWNETPGQAFYHKVDLERIALIGHSRGGEAVVAAAVFNRLSHYPDDARLSFDYHFGLRAVAAIAPIDGQYAPGGRALRLDDVDYFALHGAQDIQAPAFEGRAVYQRVRFSGEAFHFKSALYIYGANHGQFNSVWGRKDVDEPAARLFNLSSLMPMEDQQRIAEVYLSAFLEASLRGQAGYRPMFRDARYAGGWLPNTIYITQYSDSNTRPISTYEEDLDVGSTTLPGGRQLGQNLTVWREGLVLDKYGDSVYTAAAFLGWDQQAGLGQAAYVLRLPETGLEADAQTSLVFDLADAGWPTGATTAEEAARPPIDLTIQVRDRGGDSARLPLSQYAGLQPHLHDQILKAGWMSAQPSSEQVFQSFEFPLAAFVGANPQFDPTGLAEVRLIFDRTAAGVVVLDEVGLR